ncbi:hypothetical protein [Afipia sp. P52-10]|uniref:hypothetical protein n=1 Tax=Afipia sp. P52-10 TaxID=1429916 RepID=UPI001268243D|nr:hypothetical protein [Afipia sp. P52-10]
MYEREIHAVLPRVLALFDDNPVSNTRGTADRLYWSWKLIDYPNATPQGLVHGLALLIAAGKLPWNINPSTILERIDAAIDAASRQCASNGSLVEAFPHEGSFCVTALVAYDILCCIDILEPHIERSRSIRWRNCVAPMIAFLMKADETHAIISNHLATASAALFRWSEGGDARAKQRAEDLLGVILKNQSSEGWFLEYDGADPGYETLGLGYLADIYGRHPSKELETALERSLQFIRYAAHPDGSFGGSYGSRNTRFIYPAGFEILASSLPVAVALAAFARNSIATRSIPVLSSMDDTNLAPMFNAYCRALSAPTFVDSQQLLLPHQTANTWRKSMPKSGLTIDNGPGHYTIVSSFKGGIVYHFMKDRKTKPLLDAGVAVVANDKIYTTQAFNRNNPVTIRDDQLVIEAEFAAVISEQQTPLTMIILRGLSLTAFRIRPLLELFKRMLVRRLITGKKTIDLKNRRIITWGADLTVHDELIGPIDAKRIPLTKPFRAIHMASSGYWQIGDDRT